MARRSRSTAQKTLIMLTEYFIRRAMSRCIRACSRGKSRWYVSHGSAFETTKRASMCLPSAVTTPAARPRSTRIRSTRVRVWILPPRRRNSLIIACGICFAPPRAVEATVVIMVHHARVRGERRSRWRKAMVSARHRQDGAQERVANRA